MIQIHYHSGFLKEFGKLPKDIQHKLIALEDVLRENQFDPSLHTKGLHGKLRDFYAFRITRDYRVVYQTIGSSEVLFLLVGHRKDIYRKI